MAWRKDSADPRQVTPQWPTERGEHWWPVALAIVVVVGLHVVLPREYRVNTSWVLPVVLLALLVNLMGCQCCVRPTRALASFAGRRSGVAVDGGGIRVGGIWSALHHMGLAPEAPSGEPLAAAARSQSTPALSRADHARYAPRSACCGTSYRSGRGCEVA